MKIELTNNFGFNWYKNKSVFIKGYFFDSNNYFYEKENALLFLTKIETIKAFKNKLKELNGCFSIIIRINKKTLIASDTTRSFPLFYTHNKGNFFLSDDIFFLKEKFNIKAYDKLAELEFKSSLHTYGKKTLLKNVFQIQSSEYLIVKNNIIVSCGFLFSYATKKYNTSSYNYLKKQTINALENAFKRLIISLNNKPVVVPLSAGFDSRLIAVMLKKHNYKNVICYTYGKKNSFEIENSKKTAEILGLKWYFIEYNSKTIAEYLKTNIFKTYAHYAGKYSSMPFLQEYFAVKHLKEKQLINENSVFIPGFAGDFLGGSQFIKVIPKKLKSTKIIKLIYKNKYKLVKFKSYQKKQIEKEIEKNLVAFNTNYKQKIPATVFEDFDLKEKIAKYIFNSASIYTFFKYQHRFPFWDKELLEFFKKIPQKQKLAKVLFDDILINNYFKPENVYYDRELQPSIKKIKNQKIKNQIKNSSPSFIKNKLLKNNDWINYEYITNKMLVSLKENNLKISRTYCSFNEIIMWWYFYYSKGKI